MTLTASLRALPWRILFLVHGLRLALALAIAWPSAAVLGSGVENFAEADRLLFEPGAMFLVETLRQRAPALMALASPTVFGAGLALCFNLLLLAALVSKLANPERAMPLVMAQATRHWAGFVLLGGLALLVQSLIIVAFALLTKFMTTLIAEHVTEQGLTFFILGIAFAGTLVVLALGIVHDLARTALVRHNCTLRTALVLGLESMNLDWRAHLRLWVATSTPALVIFLLAGLIVGALHVELQGSWRVVGALVVHQSAAFAGLILRTLWYRGALRRVRPPLSSAADDIAEDSAGLPDPMPNPTA